MKATIIAPRYSSALAGLMMSNAPIASSEPKNAATPAHNAMSWRGFMALGSRHA